MTTVHAQQKKHKRKKHLTPVPQEFLDDCQELQPNFEKTRHKVKSIYHKWVEKGSTAQEITRWLRPILRQWYTPSAITDMIPSEMKRKYVKSGKYVGFTKDGKNVPASQRAPKMPGSRNLVAQGQLSATIETMILPHMTELGDTRTESVKTHARGSLSRFTQGADEYEIEELDLYDIDYLRIIVKWLHQLRMDFVKEAFKWQTKFDEMRKEKAAFVAKLEAHGIKP